MRLLSLSTLLLVAACGGDDLADDSGTGDSGDTVGNGLSEEDQARLTALEEEMAGFESWQRSPSWPGVEESGGAHGAYVEIWLDDVLRATVDAQAGDPVPVGAVAVKRGYDDAAGTEVRALTAMKKTGEDEWFFAAWAADGSLNAAGQVDFCLGCHGGIDPVLGESW